MDEPLAIGSRVERCNSPADTLIADGVVGVIVEAIEAANGEWGYFVQVEDGGRRFFCAGSRLRAAPVA
jgi:hypothetical protein